VQRAPRGAGRPAPPPPPPPPPGGGGAPQALSICTLPPSLPPSLPLCSSPPPPRTSSLAPQAPPGGGEGTPPTRFPPAYSLRSLLAPRSRGTMSLSALDSMRSVSASGSWTGRVTDVALPAGGGGGSRSWFAHTETCWQPPHTAASAYGSSRRLPSASKNVRAGMTAARKQRRASSDSSQQRTRTCDNESLRPPSSVAALFPTPLSRLSSSTRARSDGRLRSQGRVVSWLLAMSSDLNTANPSSSRKPAIVFPASPRCRRYGSGPRLATCAPLMKFSASSRDSRCVEADRGAMLVMRFEVAENTVSWAQLPDDREARLAMAFLSMDKDCTGGSSVAGRADNPRSLISATVAIVVLATVISIV
jgi:hypothetical protein